MEEKLLGALNYRYAVKKFDAEKKLSETQVETLLESARLTATSYGLQLMKIVVVENPELRQQLVKCSFGQEQVRDASHLLVLCRERDLELKHFETYVNQIAKTRSQDPESLEGFKNMMVNSILTKSEDEQVIWLEKQVYIKLGNLLTACAVLGIDSCPMEGFIPEEYDRILGLSERNLASVLALPIGFRSADDKNSKLKKVRRPKDDFLITLS
jgi:nitroreductase